MRAASYKSADASIDSDSSCDSFHRESHSSHTAKSDTFNASDDFPSQQTNRRKSALTHAERFAQSTSVLIRRRSILASQSSSFGSLPLANASAASLQKRPSLQNSSPLGIHPHNSDAGATKQSPTEIASPQLHTTRQPPQKESVQIKKPTHLQIQTQKRSQSSDEVNKQVKEMTPSQLQTKQRRTENKVPLLRFPSDFRIPTPIGKHESCIDLLLTHEIEPSQSVSQTDRPKSSLSILTQRANKEVNTALHVLQSTPRRRLDAHQQYSILENADQIVREAQQSFEKNMEQVSQMLDELKTHRPHDKEAINSFGGQVSMTKDAIDNTKSRKSDPKMPGYLQPTKASDIKSVGRHTEKVYEGIFEKIARLRANPEQCYEFQTGIDDYLRDKRDKLKKVEPKQQVIPFRIRLERRRKEKEELLRRQLQEEEYRIYEAQERKKREEIQRRWSWLSVLGSRHYLFAVALKKSRNYRIQFSAETKAALIIQRAYRKHYEIQRQRKMKWSRLVLQSVLIRYGQRRREEKRERSATTIVSFLRDTEQVNALAKAVRKFQFAVLTIQRFWRKTYPIMLAQLELLSLFYQSVENIYVKSFKQQLRERKKKNTDYERPIFGRPPEKKSKHIHIPRTGKKVRAALVRSILLKRKMQYITIMTAYGHQYEDYMRKVHIYRTRLKIRSNILAKSGEASLLLKQKIDDPNLIEPPRPHFKVLPSMMEISPIVEKALRDAFQEYNLSSNHPIIFTEFELPKFKQLQGEGSKTSSRRLSVAGSDSKAALAEAAEL